MEGHARPVARFVDVAARAADVVAGLPPPLDVLGRDVDVPRDDPADDGSGNQRGGAAPMVGRKPPDAREDVREKTDRLGRKVRDKGEGDKQSRVVRRLVDEQREREPESEEAGQRQQ